MIILHLPKIKEFMKHLLLLENFDSFECVEGEIVTFCKYHIDGFRQNNYPLPLTKEACADQNTYVPWATLRNQCHQLIKGPASPLSFRFIFRLGASALSSFALEDVIDFKTFVNPACYLNLKYEGQQLLLTTGCSSDTFTMDKSLERAWDKECTLLLDRLGIEWEIPQENT